MAKENTPDLRAPPALPQLQARELRDWKDLGSPTGLVRELQPRYAQDSYTEWVKAKTNESVPYSQGSVTS